MATQNVVIGANSNVNDFKCIIYEAATPSTVVQEHIVPFPHSSNQLVSFTGLNLVSHIVRTYEWVGGALGALIHQYLLQPTEDVIKSPEDIQLVVGVDLTPGANSWNGIPTHPIFAGKVVNVDYRVEQRGIGSLTIAEVTNNGSFGFQLTGGQLFNDGDTFFIHWFPRIVVNPANYTTNSSGGYLDIIEVTGNYSVVVNNANKLFDINRTLDGVAPILTLDALANIADMKFFGFKMDRGIAVNAVIKAQTGEAIYFNGQVYNEIYLGQNEYCKIVKKGTAFHIESSNINYNDVGNVATSTSLNRKGYVHAAGNALPRNVYPKLFNIHVASISVGNGLINEASWATNNGTKTNFTLGDGVTTFRIPDYRGLFPRFFDDGRGLDEVRALASTNTSIGNFQDSENKEHDHATGFTRDNNSVGEGSGTGVAVTGLPVGSQLKTAKQGQKEVTVKNTVFYALIKC
jgi:hypothetical protein